MPPPATPTPTPATPAATSIHTAPPPAGFQWVNVGGVVALQPISTAAPAVAPAPTPTTAAAPAAGGLKMDKITWPVALLIIAGGYLVLAAFTETGPFRKGGDVPPPPAQAQNGSTPQSRGGGARGPHNPQCNPCPAGYGHYGRKPGSPCWCTTQ